MRVFIPSGLLGGAIGSFTMLAFEAPPLGSASSPGHDAETCKRDSRIQHRIVALAGTEYQNRDGTDRQEIGGQCFPREALNLRHEPTNEFDRNAVGVFRNNGQQLGYLPRWLAAQTVEQMKAGYKHAAVFKALNETMRLVVSLASGTALTPRDIIIVLFIVAPDASAAEWQNYYLSWVAQEIKVSDKGEK